MQAAAEEGRYVQIILRNTRSEKEEEREGRERNNKPKKRRKEKSRLLSRRERKIEGE